MTLRSSGVLRFLHIEKTAGSSLRAELERTLAERVALDYNATGRAEWLLPFMGEQQGMDVPPVIKPLEALAELERRGVRVLAGHGAFNRWSSAIPGYRTFLFLRNPLERCVSGWHHGRRLGHVPAGESVVDYAIPRSNLYCQRTEGLELREAFVGITEWFAESVARLNARFELKLEPIEANVNPLKKLGDSYELEPAEIEKLRHIHRDDLRLYERELERFEARPPWARA